MKRVIMLRHGQSQWNLENRFTGWTDVELTDEEIVSVEIPTGKPWVFELDDNLGVKKEYYL